MSHVQKPDFVFRWNGRVHLSLQGRQFSCLLAAEVCGSAVVMLDTPCSEVVWRVLSTHSIRQFPLHFPLPCVTVCHHISTGLYVCMLTEHSLSNINLHIARPYCPTKRKYLTTFYPKLYGKSMWMWCDEMCVLEHKSLSFLSAVRSHKLITIKIFVYAQIW